MEKSLRKLVAAVMSLLLATILLVTMSYAWVTLSSAPIAEGIQISIGGGNIIMIAPDQSVMVGDEEYHYPGAFGQTLKFHQAEAYSYLNEIASLTPVSTADGVHWIIPEYYDLADKEIQNGEAVAGQVKPIERFTLDTELEYANLSTESGEGCYIFLDFWVVSPGSDYQLRVSKGDETAGSYLLELMEPVEVDEDGDGVAESYTLTSTAGDAAAAARVGFLVNEDQVTDDTMRYYQDSYTYKDTYTKLKGIYHQRGEMMWYSASYRFTVYEPNGDLHPSGTNGVYQTTAPLAWNGSEIYQTEISDRVAVQLTNRWRTRSSQGISVEQLFQTAIVGDSFETTEEVKNEFYREYLQGQMMPYVQQGDFITNTSTLYSKADANGTVSADALSAIESSGATEDVTIVTLEKNVPQRIRMFVWLEGQDADCTNAASALDLALSIELAGSNQDAYEGTSTEQELSQQNSQIAGFLAPDPIGFALPVRSDTGTWKGLRYLW